MDHATKHQLTYLSDAMLALMFTDNVAPVFSTELKKINNIVVIGQYLDFIRNQRFRCTLLCHQDQKINRGLKTTSVEDFNLTISGKMQEVPPETPDGEPSLTLGNSLVTLKLTNPKAKRALQILQDQKNKPISYQRFCELLLETGDFKSMDEVKKHVNEELNMMRLVLAGLIQISSYPGEYTTEVSENPIACPLVRYQATKQNFATNRRHQVISLEPLSKEIIPLLDGKHNLKDIEDLVRTKVKDDKIKLVDKEKKDITDPELIEKEIKTHCELLLHNMARNAILIG